MDKDKLYRISIFEEEKFKRYVAKLGVDDLKELQSYFDRAMPVAKQNKGINLKIRLTNYKYFTKYMADDQTINRMKLEEQKKRSMEQLKWTIDNEMENAIAKYRIARYIPIDIILTTGEHYQVMLDFSVTWSDMKQIYDRGFICDCELADCEEILSPESYKNNSKLHLKGGESLFIRNSQIIGMTVDKETAMANVSDFVIELVRTTNKYNLSDHEIDSYFTW